MQNEKQTFVFMDLEDSQQQGEDSSTELKLKEYNLNKLTGLERIFILSYSIEHAQLGTARFSNVFPDIDTPPPRV